MHFEGVTEIVKWGPLFLHRPDLEGTHRATNNLAYPIFSFLGLLSLHDLFAIVVHC
jgi:hypothetical protein